MGSSRPDLRSGVGDFHALESLAADHPGVLMAFSQGSRGHGWVMSSHPIPFLRGCNAHIPSSQPCHHTSQQFTCYYTIHTSADLGILLRPFAQLYPSMYSVASRDDVLFGALRFRLSRLTMTVDRSVSLLPKLLLLRNHDVRTDVGHL